MKTHNTIPILIVIIVMFTVATPAIAYPTGYITPPHDEINLTNIEILQQEIDKRGYKWTVGETSVSRLSQEEKRALCGPIILAPPPHLL